MLGRGGNLLPVNPLVDSPVLSLDLCFPSASERVGQDEPFPVFPTPVVPWGPETGFVFMGKRGPRSGTPGPYNKE